MILISTATSQDHQDHDHARTAQAAKDQQYQEFL